MLILFFTNVKINVKYFLFLKYFVLKFVKELNENIMTLEQLIQEERELTEKLMINKSLQKTIREVDFTAKTGISIGDLVSISGKMAVICRIRHSYFELDFLYRLILKDGSIGKREQRLYYNYNLKKTKIIKKSYIKPEDF